MGGRDLLDFLAVRKRRAPGAMSSVPCPLAGQALSTVSLWGICGYLGWSLSPWMRPLRCSQSRLVLMEYHAVISDVCDLLFVSNPKAPFPCGLSVQAPGLWQPTSIQESLHPSREHSRTFRPLPARPRLGEPLVLSLAVSPDSSLSTMAAIIPSSRGGCGPRLNVELLLETCNLP